MNLFVMCLQLNDTYFMVVWIRDFCQRGVISPTLFVLRWRSCMFFFSLITHCSCAAFLIINIKQQQADHGGRFVENIYFVNKFHFRGKRLRYVMSFVAGVSPMSNDHILWGGREGGVEPRMCCKCGGHFLTLFINTLTTFCVLVQSANKNTKRHRRDHGAISRKHHIC